MTEGNDVGHDRQPQNAQGLGAMVEWLEANISTDGAWEWNAADAQRIFDAVDEARRGQEAEARRQPEQAEVPMADLPPPDPRVQQLLDETNTVGTAGALAQSLKAMAGACAEGARHGHAVVAARAERFVRTMHMHVTRFLQSPDLKLRHPNVDLDLRCSHVDVSDVGRVQLGCTDEFGNGWWTVPLDECHPAGPANDVMRVIVSAMAQALVQDALGDLVARGAMPGFDTFQRSMEEAQQLQSSDDGSLSVDVGDTPVHVAVDPAGPNSDHTVEVAYVRDPENPAKVDVVHLQVHESYVLDGTRAQPVVKPHAVGFEPPEDEVPSDSAWQPNNQGDPVKP